MDRVFGPIARKISFKSKPRQPEAPMSLIRSRYKLSDTNMLQLQLLLLNVLQARSWPVFNPVMNQFTRCAEVPWVKLSGTT